MTDFEEEHSKLLMRSSWLAKTHDNTAYLFKFAITAAEPLQCCFLMTDTERVYVEVLESRHVARRVKQCNPSESQGDHDTLSQETTEVAWRTRQLALLKNMHLPLSISDADFEVGTSEKADLEVHIRSELYTWRWDVMYPGHRLSAKLLSAHLFTPLISFAALSTIVDEPLRDISKTSLTRVADLQGKTAKRNLGRQIVGCISKPIVASTLQRISQVIEGVSEPTDIVLSEDDYPSTIAVPPLPIISERKRSWSVSPTNSPARPSHSKAQSQKAPAKHSDETEDEEESLPHSIPAPFAKPEPIPARYYAVPEVPSTQTLSTEESSAMSAPKPHPETSESEDSESAEARRRAQIDRIVQERKIAAQSGGPSRPVMKTAPKRRKF